MTLKPVLVGIPDVSTFQPPVDDSFNREWLIFRLTFDGSIDRNAVHNLAWAKQAHADGRLRGFTGYMVPLHGADSNKRCLSVLDQLGFPHDQVVNIDGEKWSGSSYEVFGDHSGQWNDLAEAVRARQGGRDDLVWVYGNRGPDMLVWPNKPAWAGWKVAAYTSNDWPDPPLPDNCVGWQYTNEMSIYDNPGRPHSTPPFGRCDHNMLFHLPEVDDMPTADEVAAAVARYKITDTGGPNGTGQTIAGALRHVDDVQAAVKAARDDLKTLQAAVGKIGTPQAAPIDPAVLRKALTDVVARLDIVLQPRAT